MEQISIFRFGEFTLDGAQRRLLRAGQDLYLPPKTFELLLHLLRNRGRVLTKEELLALPSREWVVDISCVTKWTHLDSNQTVAEETKQVAAGAQTLDAVIDLAEQHDLTILAVAAPSPDPPPVSTIT